jgi:hypothetical protein
MMMNSVIELDSYKKTRIEKEIHDLKQCLLLNKYYLDVLKPEDARYREQQLLRDDNELSLAELRKQLGEL